MEIRLARLDLQPFLPAAAEEDAAAGASWGTLAGVPLPRMVVSIERLGVGARELGNWRFDLGSTGEVLTVDGVQGRMPGAHVGGRAGEAGARLRLGWPHGAPVTDVDARIEFDDIGVFFDNWKQARVLESRTGSGEFVLAWPGGPTDLVFAAATGSVDLAFREGRLLREGSNNPLMRAIGLLRFDELLRRMKFDFKDFYQSGLVFDRFDAGIAFDDGVARTRSPIELEGPAARMRLEGRSDLRAQRIDAALTVTLPIGSNLPWVAALAGGPAMAAGVFVASRLFESQIGKLSSAVYSVTGPLDDPKVEFQKVFDVETPPANRATAAKKRTATPPAATPPS